MKTKVLAVVLILMVATAAVAAINHHSRISQDAETRATIAGLWCPDHGYGVWEMEQTEIPVVEWPAMRHGWIMRAWCVECPVGNQ